MQVTNTNFLVSNTTQATTTTEVSEPHTNVIAYSVPIAILVLVGLVALAIVAAKRYAKTH